MDQDTLSTYLLYEGGPPGVRLRTSLRIPVAGAPAVFDLLGNTTSWPQRSTLATRRHCGRRCRFR